MMLQQKYFFQCLKCNKKISDASEELTECMDCGGPVTIKMNMENLRAITTKKQFFEQKIKSMWSFFDFLPLLNKKNIISLCEGNTPLLKSIRLAHNLTLKNLIFKLDFLNPTGSFKDRQISMGISKAIELNKNSVITVSSGNVGASVAAYSARAGLKNIILIPSIAPESKIIQIKRYGGNVVKVDSDSTKYLSEIVQQASKYYDMANLITAAIYNPYIIKGAKTISYEIAIQCRECNISFPDVIVIPVGGSGLLTGVYEGFEELYNLDFIDAIPKLIAVQPEGCAPFVRAIQKELTPEYLFENPWKEIKTISTALADDIPLDCYTGIPAIRNTNGSAVSVSDQETLNAGTKLATLEGIFAEPSSCTPIAALEKLRERDIIQSDESVCCLITGSGFKDIKSIESQLPESITVPKEFEWKKIFEKFLTP